MLGQAVSGGAMTVDELIEKLQALPGEYHSYTVCVFSSNEDQEDEATEVKVLPAGNSVVIS
jgi:hypothetical protein